MADADADSAQSAEGVVARTSKRQQQAAATQEQLVLAARDVFEERGYQATTVGAITERAQTAHGTFYLYFKNKEAVFCEVMAGAAAELAREASSSWDRDPETGLEVGMRGFLRVFEQHGGLWRALLEGSFQSPRVMDLWLEIRQGFIDRLAVVFARLQGSGDVRQFDPELVAHALGAMTEWFAFTHLVMQRPPAGEGAQERAAEILTDLWLHAIWGRLPDR